LQVTDVSLLPVTVALNCWTCPRNMLAVVGATLTATGCRITVAFADLVKSAWLVAVTVTVCVAGIVVGAVYRPLAEIDPTLLGVIDQVTAVLPVPVTVALNCCVWEANALAVAGVTFTATATLYLKSRGTYIRPVVPGT